ncbi:hypothetical protein GGS24DRAFT_152090 [Hypoxylon argillaceum]|nr:hypothetical protein GGS24DRAFT_152090 [Hypoxylon argillaceum]
MPLPILIPTALSIFPTCADQLFIHLLTLPTTCLIPTYHSALILTTPFEHTHIIRPYPPHFWRNTDSIHFHTACIPQGFGHYTARCYPNMPRRRNTGRGGSDAAAAAALPTVGVVQARSQSPPQPQDQDQLSQQTQQLQLEPRPEHYDHHAQRNGADSLTTTGSTSSAWTRP